LLAFPPEARRLVYMRMKSSSGNGGTGGSFLLPAGDQELVGPLGLLGDGSFLVALVLAVVCRAGPTVVAAL